MFNDPARSTITLADLLERLAEVEPEGTAYVALCPAHNDSRPSLRIAYTDAKRVLLKCRAGCPTESVVAAIDLTMAHLHDVEPGDLTDVRTTSQAARELAPGDLSALALYLDRATASLADNGADALAYAADRFGITEATALELGLGYDDGTVDSGRVGLSRARFRNAPRLVVPLNDFEGNPHGFQGRALTSAEPRWSGPNNPDGATWGKFGVLSAGSDRPEILLTEGPGDGITAVAAGYDAVVVRGASLGTSPGLADNLAAGLRDRLVVVAGDADTAGETFARNVTEALAGRGVDVRRLIISTDAGNDLSDWRTKAGEEFPAALAKGISAAAPAATVDEPAETPKDNGEPRISGDTVATFIENNYRLGRSTDGLVFAVPTYEGSNRIAREVRSIRNDVLRRFREDRKKRTGRGVVIGRDTLSAALDLVAALAEDTEEEAVAIRAAQVGDDRVVLDLGDATGQAVEVTTSGWTVRQPSADLPLFRRSSATRPLPVPERGGSMGTLCDLLGLKPTDRQWLLLRGWLVGSLFADFPRPLLWVVGPQGSGKSTRARMALSLIEPSDSLGKEPGKNERDDSTGARGRYLVSYDNISHVSQNTSDWLCRLVTGVTDDRRALYSDDDLRPVSYKRSGVATSIVLPPGLGSDALERIALVNLDRVPDDERRSEADLWAAFEEKGWILGALLDDVVLGLRHMRAVRAERRPRPRMADYADILLALDRGLDLAEDAGHLAAYVGTVDEALAERAFDDPFTAAILSLVKEAGGHWRGPAETLLKHVNSAHGFEADRPKWWPASARAVAAQCQKASEALRHAGVTFKAGKSNGFRFIELTGTVATPDRP